MSRIGPISGFPELLPAQRIVEQQVLDRMRTTFELHGFASIETRAVEPMEQLLRKGEIDKEVYVLRRLHAAEGEGDAGMGLHFDLTVPFARYVLENAGRLEFPFRRYQIQKVWRGERPQEGRYREFTQADIDVVAREELPFHHDVEVAKVMAEALSALPVPPLRLQVNNRALMEGFFAQAGAKETAVVMQVIDKIDKVPPDAITTMLVEQAGLDEAQAQRCVRFASVRATGSDSLREQLDALGVDWSDPMLSAGFAQLDAVLAGCSAFASDRFAVEADLRIARGLDYYTGTVFETRMAGFESLGSICSGGRYEALASDGHTTYPGVGISLGVTRMLVPLLAQGVVTATRSVPSAVLVALKDESTRWISDEVADALRARGIAAEVAPSAQKYGKQIRVAERRGIPFVWFPADPDPRPTASPSGHEVRDIRSGEQVPADPHAWQPPETDRRPRVVIEGETEK